MELKISLKLNVKANWKDIVKVEMILLQDSHLKIWQYVLGLMLHGLRFIMVPKLEQVLEEVEEKPEIPKKVTIFTSCRSVMDEGEPVYLTSKLEGFDDCETIIYIWKVNKGNGYEVIEGADEATYTFTATMESLTWSWHLTVLCR